MNPEQKQIWRDALLSGEYSQGRGWLKRESEDGTTEYCCLGVLCEKAVEEGVIPEPTRRVLSSGKVVFAYGEEGTEEILPREVMEWAGMQSAGGHVDSYNLPSDTLYGLNDGEGYSFVQLSDVIEEHF